MGLFRLTILFDFLWNCWNIFTAEDAVQTRSFMITCFLNNESRELLKKCLKINFITLLLNLNFKLTANISIDVRQIHFMSQ